MGVEAGKEGITIYILYFFLAIEVRKGFHLLFIYLKFCYIVSWVFIGRTDVEAETVVFWPPDAKS